MSDMKNVADVTSNNTAGIPDRDGSTGPCIIDQQDWRIDMHANQVMQRAANNPELVAKMSEYLAVTYMPSFAQHDFQDELVPLAKMKIMAMYQTRATPHRPAAIALTGHKVLYKPRARPQCVFGGFHEHTLARNWALPLVHIDNGVNMGLNTDYELCRIGFEMDAAIERAARSIDMPRANIQVPNQVVALHPEYNFHGEDTEAMWEEIRPLFSTNGKLLPQWVLPAPGVVDNIERIFAYQQYFVRHEDGTRSRISFPRWCRGPEDLAVGKRVEGQQIFPPILGDNPTRLEVLHVTGPTSLQWLMRDVIESKVEWVTLHRVYDTSGNGVGTYREMRIVPTNLVPTQVLRGCGIYLDMRGLLGRKSIVSDGRCAAVRTYPRRAVIQVVHLGQPPDSKRGLTYTNRIQGWGLDLASLPSVGDWLTVARDG